MYESTPFWGCSGMQQGCAGRLGLEQLVPIQGCCRAFPLRESHSACQEFPAHNPSCRRISPTLVMSPASSGRALTCSGACDMLVSQTWYFWSQK